MTKELLKKVRDRLLVYEDRMAELLHSGQAWKIAEARDEAVHDMVELVLADVEQVVAGVRS